MYKKAIVVLGVGIDAAGNLGPDSKVSVDLAIHELGKTSNSCLIMTGYVSYKASFKPSISEAQAMKDYAVSLGVEPNKVFVETESKDSLGNFLFTKLNLLAPLGIFDLIIIRGPNQTDERISYLAKKILGDRYSFGIISAGIERPNEWEREEKSLNLAKHWLEDVEDGDTDSIYRLIRQKHPGYNGSIGLESLQELL